VRAVAALRAKESRPVRLCGAVTITIVIVVVISIFHCEDTNVFGVARRATTAAAIGAVGEFAGLAARVGGLAAVSRPSRGSYAAGPAVAGQGLCEWVGLKR